MISEPIFQPEDDRVAEMPRVCRLLFNAPVDSVLIGAPLSPAADIVRADPAVGKLLHDHLESRVGGDIKDDSMILEKPPAAVSSKLLESMIAREVARRVMHEIKNPAAEK